jgi:hypothetical protein
MILYSGVTKGFYDTGIHKKIPEGSIEITEEDHKRLLEGQSKGKVIIIDEYNRVVLSDPVIDPVVIAKSIRDEALLNMKCDLGDGRIIQTRPQDEQNIRNAIEIMQSYNYESCKWVMLDNKKYDTTVEELKKALSEGQKQAMKIWGDYNP